MPMRPVREDVYDTAPMRPMNIRSGYEGYRRTIDRRREVIRTERPGFWTCEFPQREKGTYVRQNSL